MVTLHRDKTKFTVIVKDGACCKGYDTVWIKHLTKSLIMYPMPFHQIMTEERCFSAIPVGNASKELFRIFNRYGELVFATSQWMKGWNGMHRGKP